MFFFRSPNLCRFVAQFCWHHEIRTAQTHTRTSARLRAYACNGLKWLSLPRRYGECMHNMAEIELSIMSRCWVYAQFRFPIRFDFLFRHPARLLRPPFFVGVIEQNPYSVVSFAVFTCNFRLCTSANAPTIGIPMHTAHRIPSIWRERARAHRTTHRRWEIDRQNKIDLGIRFRWNQWNMRHICCYTLYPTLYAVCRKMMISALTAAALVRHWIQLAVLPLPIYRNAIQHACARCLID